VFAPANELSRQRRLLVLAICCMSLLIVSLDNTIVNIALPSLQREFHASVTGLQWTVDAYLLVLASLLTLAGSTADRLGRRRVFQTGLVVFVSASLLCSLAPSLDWLVAFRMAQAVGGSMLNPVAMSIITNTFVRPAERARAIGVWGATIGVSMGLGPVVGGTLVGSVGWRAIFWINVPVGLTALLLAALFVPESRAPRPRRVDPVGQLLVIVGLASLTYGIIQGPRSGWGSDVIVASFVLAGLALAGLVGYEARRPEPLIDPRFFRSAPFSGAVAIAVSAFAAFGGFMFMNTIYLQEVRGLSALHAGLWTLPIALMGLLFAPVAGRLVGSRGARLPLVIAGAGMTGAGLLMTGLGPHVAMARLLAAYLLLGLGLAMVNTPVTNAAVSGMPRTQAGVAASIASTSRQVGQSLGVAVVGSVIASALHGHLRTDFVRASHPAWWIITGFGVVIFCVGLVTTGRWARGTAARTAARLDPDARQVALGASMS
jgi:EmrB/QacA subfamily drug resistance transporter